MRCNVERTREQTGVEKSMPCPYCSEPAGNSDPENRHFLLINHDVEHQQGKDSAQPRPVHAGCHIRQIAATRRKGGYKPIYQSTQ